MASNYEQLLGCWQGYEEFTALQRIAGEGQGPCSVFGVPEGAVGSMCAALIKGQSALIVAKSEEEAQKLSEELQLLRGDAGYLPPREIQLAAYLAGSRELSGKRVGVLEDLRAGRIRSLVVGPEGALQAMAPPEQFARGSLELQVGQEIPLDQLAQRISAAGYERVDKVDAPGQFRLSGSILDLYPLSAENPLRVEFFDEEVDSIRSFDASTQRSLEKLEKISLPPAGELVLTPEARQRARQLLEKERKKAGAVLSSRIDELLSGLEKGRAEGAEQLLPLFYEPCTIREYLPRNALVLVLEPHRVDERIQELSGQFAESLAQRLEAGDAFALQSALLLEPGPFWRMLEGQRTVLFQAVARSFAPIRPKELLRMEARAAVCYNGDLETLSQELSQLKRRGMAVLLYAGPGRRGCAGHWRIWKWRPPLPMNSSALRCGGRYWCWSSPCCVDLSARRFICPF